MTKTPEELERDAYLGGSPELQAAWVALEEAQHEAVSTSESHEEELTELNDMLGTALSIIYEIFVKASKSDNPNLIKLANALSEVPDVPHDCDQDVLQGVWKEVVSIGMLDDPMTSEFARFIEDISMTTIDTLDVPGVISSAKELLS